MKPEHTRPFDIEHARAGAPFCCRDGAPFEALKWDAKNRAAPIIGLRGSKSEVSTLLSPSGKVVASEDNPGDLVMTPLGMLDGKPVFVGDELLWNVETIKAMPGWKPADLGNCRWPAPAKVYPETLMDTTALCRVYADAPHPIHEKVSWTGLRDVANAALRHAIDEGQIVPAVEQNELSDKLIAAKSELAEMIHTGIVIPHIGTVYGTKKAMEFVAKMLGPACRQEDRDMAIAKAVRASLSRSDVRDVSLLSIIAGVKS